MYKKEENDKIVVIYKITKLIATCKIKGLQCFVWLFISDAEISKYITQ
jgi:hypothetical protein